MAINKFHIEPTCVSGFKYNVQVWTSVDGGHDFYYCGNGRFCKNLTEVFWYIRTWQDPWCDVVDYRNRRYPNAKIVTAIPEGRGWMRDLTTHDKPAYGEWYENFRTGERVIVYTGGKSA